MKSFSMCVSGCLLLTLVVGFGVAGEARGQSGGNAARPAQGAGGQDKSKQNVTATTTTPTTGTEPQKGSTDQAPKPVAVTEALTGKVDSNAARVAMSMQQLSIVGLAQVIATSDKELVFLVDRKALMASIKPAPADKGEEAIADLGIQLRKIAKALVPGARVESQMIDLPSGAKAAEVMPLIKKLPGVIDAITVGDGYLLVMYDSSVPSVAKFLEKMRRPEDHVDSMTQRLYYMTAANAGTEVAKVINDMYPDVSAAFLGPDMIQLSTRSLPNPKTARHTDTIEDALRTIAKIDQPRPRASLDVWAIQIAGKSSAELEKVTPQIEQLTSAYNESMSGSLLRGWSVLTKRHAYSRMLQSYLTLPPVCRNGVCTHPVSATGASGDKDAGCDANSKEEKSKEQKNGETDCGFSLGYEALLEPVIPNLIDMLINIVAQEKPKVVADAVVEAMEGPELHDFRNHPATGEAKQSPTIAGTEQMKATLEVKQIEDTDKAKKIQKECTITCDPKSISLLEGGVSWCRHNDLQLYQKWIKSVLDNCKVSCGEKDILFVPPGLALSCVNKELTQHLFADSRGKEVRSLQDGKLSTSAIGQFQAAVADFLFQYELMVKFPNSFHWHQEPMSADTLDMALLPIVDAFYDDLGVFQEVMQTEVYKLLNNQHVTYSSSGLVSMKMIAGTQGIVNSKSQHLFETSQAASAAEVGEAIASIKTDPVAASSQLMKLLTPTPVKTSIGKQLDLTATVHSLSGAYGMELDLLIDSAENGASQVVQSGATTSTDDLSSRVATHHLQTKVRVDSLKLFEVSTARSLVVRGQKPWVLVDPYFEIPVLSQLVKKPRKPQAVYTQSLLFVNALVVPTAIDLAFGSPISDKVTVNKIDEDLIGLISRYHQRVVHYLATGALNEDGSVSYLGEWPTWERVAEKK